MTADLENRLGQELDRISRGASPLQISPDTWSRGRRALTRDRVVTVIAVAVAIGCLGSLSVLLRPGTGEAVPSSPSDGTSQIGVPNRIWAVPDRLVERRENPTNEVTWNDGVRETDLAIGRAAVAFTAGESGHLVVVVDAARGKYHPLALPGYVGAGFINTAFDAGTPLTLSPNGMRLAYGWWDPSAPLDAPMPAGIRILDLRTGEIETVAIEGGNGVRVDTITWSPDGTWLGWTGARSKSWTPMGSTYGDLIAGRVTPTGKVEYRPDTLADHGRVAISNKGVVTVNVGDRLNSWGDEITRTIAAPQLAVPATASPSNDYVALTSNGVATSFSVLVRGLGGRFGLDVDRTIRPATEYVVQPVALPRGLADEGAEIRPLGWTSDQTVLVLVDRSRGDLEGDDDLLATVTLDPNHLDAPAEFDIVTRIAPAVHNDVTVAVDLMTGDFPTVDRPEPDWPMTTERKTLIGFLIALSVLVGAFVVRRLRRR